MLNQLFTCTQGRKMPKCRACISCSRGTLMTSQLMFMKPELPRLCWS